MANRATFEEVKALVTQLTRDEQRRLLAYIADCNSDVEVAERNASSANREYVTRVEAFLAMCVERPARATGPVDSAEDIRQIREERVSRPL